MRIPVRSSHPFKAAQLLVCVQFVVILVFILLSILLFFLLATCFRLFTAYSHLFAGDGAAAFSSALCRCTPFKAFLAFLRSVAYVAWLV